MECDSTTLRSDTASDYFEGLVADTCNNIFQKIALESFLRAEITFRGHSKSSKIRLRINVPL